MGASNFYNKNASNIFAVLLNYEQPLTDDEGNELEETETVSPESWEYDDFKSNFTYEMKERFGNDFVKGGADDHDRNYHGTALGRVMIDKDYMGVTLEIELTAMLRSAYYEGANLDWELTFYVDGYEHDDLVGALEEWEYQASKDFNLGLVRANKNKVERWLSQTKDSMVERLETLFKEHSEHSLRVVGRFSNGETIYETA